jgi:hypothetical protein
LAKQTPHRVMRELYEQQIAYGRAYADSIPTYTPSDDFLAGANISAGESLGAICDAITFGSASSRSLAVAAVPPPTKVSPVGNPANPERFLVTPDSTCVAWVQREDRFIADTQAWVKLDPNIPATQWTPEQRASQQAALPILAAHANDIATAGRQSGNPTLEDFAVLSSLYFQAFVSSGDGYVAADNYLSTAGVRLGNLISAACRAAAA